MPDEFYAQDGLDQDEQDALAATSRALAGLIPGFGGVVGEFFTKTIPAQRMDRIVAYLRQLKSRLDEQDAAIANLMKDPERADLIEEGAYQAARATTTDRIASIAALVANGITSDEANIVRQKRLARLLSEIDDDEVLLLNAYGQSFGGDGSAAWDAIDRPYPPSINEGIDRLDASKLFDAGQDNLLRLGLLEKSYRSPRRGEIAEFNPRDGDFPHHIQLAYLGRLLLRYIGKPTPLDTTDIERES